MSLGSIYDSLTMMLKGKWSCKAKRKAAATKACATLNATDLKGDGSGSGSVSPFGSGSVSPFVGRTVVVVDSSFAVVGRRNVVLMSVPSM